MMRLGLTVSLRGAMRKIHIRHVSTASWATSDFPWSHHAREEAEKKETRELAERHRIQMKKMEFEGLVLDRVRALLPQKFPVEFSVHSNDALLSRSKAEVTPIMETLATLNGYERVPLPLPYDLVSLAEGITVAPDFYTNGSLSKSMFLFVQPIDAHAYPNVQDKKFPELVEEDYRLYAVMENATEDLITSIYDSTRMFFYNKIVNPFDKLASRLITETEPLNVDPIGPTLPVVKDNTLQNLIVLESGNAALITHMTPSVRLLALPYKLGHKSASTLISVSLVVFGAAPLAYRSLNFALNYPLLSEVIAASVLGTIMYGIWSGRSISRTRQSEVVSKGMGSRIYARDDAVLWALQEGAVQRVSQLIVADYYDALNDLLDSDDGKQSRPEIPLVDLQEMLTEIGLIVPESKEKMGGQHIVRLLDKGIATIKTKSRDEK